MPSDSTQSPKPIVFISYAHADEPEKPRDEEIQWLSFVMKFLRPAVKYGEFRIWVDPQIPAGTPWDPEIERHLQACSVFVLLISANSMASYYIIDRELAIARQRQATGAMQICPLLIEATPKAGLARVLDLNVRPPGLKPLQSYPLADRNQHMSDAADEIADMVRAIAKRNEATTARENDLAVLNREILGPGEVSIIVGQRGTGKSGLVMEPPYPPTLAVLDITGLPETGYERLVGREGELARLDEAWSDAKTNILSLIAEGGAGKSALVNEWLARLQADRYRGATCVLG
jgi:TIR domain